MKTLDTLATALVIVGGINWGLVGLAQFDLVASLLGEMSVATRAVYTLVGLSAAYLAVRRLSQANETPLVARAR